MHNIPRRREDDAPLGIGIIGGGDISARYAKCVASSTRFKLVGMAGRGDPTKELVANPLIDIILNLTPPLAHADVSRLALAAGKHVYSEKPLSHDMATAQTLVAFAEKQGLTLACAPATFLGPAQQFARTRVDSGELGKIIGARGIIMYRGPDLWHHNPAPLFGRAAGPLFDMGVYHISALVALFGPIIDVYAMGSQAFSQRRVCKGPRSGDVFDVTIPTHVSTIMRFENGAIADLVFSFDGMGSAAPALEIFGTDGCLSLPQPSFFQGPLKQITAHNAWVKCEAEASDWNNDVWIAGLHAMTDHLEGLDEPWPSNTMALHVLEAMTCIETSIETGRKASLTTPCVQPSQLTPATVKRWVNFHRRVA